MFRTQQTAELREHFGSGNTLLPDKQFSAKQVATLYHERWKIELGFRDIKSSMQDNTLTLRSKTVDLVYQELWGVLLNYNVVRREANQAAVAHKRAPHIVITRQHSKG